MKTDEKEPKCSDCVFFVQHYSKSRLNFTKVFECGHCTNRKPSGHSRKLGKVCECFEKRDDEAIKNQQTKSVQQALSDMADRLAEMKEFLIK